MGLAALIVIFKILDLWKNDVVYQRLARFWIRIFGFTFAVGYTLYMYHSFRGKVKLPEDGEGY